MSIKITISDNSKYLIGKVDEPLTREIAQQLVKEYVNLIKTTGINRILNDVRGAPNTMNTLQDYDYAYTDVQHFDLPHNVRAAIVADVGDTTHNFQETVARNAGYLVKVFHAIEPAIAWLLEDNPY